MAWAGIIGKSFAAPEQFSSYFDTITFGAWRPRFVVVHNTSAPDLQTYANWQTRHPPVTDEQWAKNLEAFFRDDQHWSAGPHLFVTPKSIIAFTPLKVPGVHSPSWNAISWGVETVGEFQSDPFDGTVRDNLVATLGILHAKSGLQLLPYQKGVRGLHFHKEDPKTTHKSCPGKNVVKTDLIRRTQDYIDHLHAGEHQVAPLIS